MTRGWPVGTPEIRWSAGMRSRLRWDRLYAPMCMEQGRVRRLRWDRLYASMRMGH
ncbi:MAG: hypothetical protein H0V04_05320 [Chloroflexi bacterium]|nr:hypothetical protein [Chloroflexota bacterium]